MLVRNFAQGKLQPAWEPGVYRLIAYNSTMTVATIVMSDGTEWIENIEHIKRYNHPPYHQVNLMQAVYNPHIPIPPANIHAGHYHLLPPALPLGPMPVPLLPHTFERPREPDSVLMSYLMRHFRV